jgi:DNA-binding transcriptional MerR regulator
VATKGVNAMNKSADAFRTIGEVAGELDIPKHVLRFWEGRFPQIRPMKRGGGRRYYRPEDMELLRGIRTLLHSDGYTIKGVQKILREQGIDEVKSAATRLSAVEAQSRSSGRGSRKRGRKPVAAVAAAPVKDPVPQHQVCEISGAIQDGRSTHSTTRIRVLAALRELEIARAILLGKPPEPIASAADTKKVRAGSP